MKPLDQLSSSALSAVRVVFTDIDGTLTDAHGRIPAGVFAAMEAARAAGVAVVPITGRPAGWCDMIARTWPVDGVVGENGGLYFRREEADHGGDRMIRVYAQDEPTRRSNRARLDRVAAEVLAAVPGTALASDQQYREFDIAIDFCEDVPALPEGEIDRIVALCAAAGCTVKVSNIHVNAWFGAFDKASMCRRFAREILDLEIDGPQGRAALFFGDSPNDAPLFALFELSVGVANVARMADRIPSLPAYVAQGDGADGFVEGVRALLAAR